MRQSKISNHKLLPTVTLGEENDAFVPWGATLPTKSGQYIYTSFTPPGFLLPYVVFKIFDLSPSVINIARLNSTIGAAAGVILYVLLFQISVYLGSQPPLATAAALAGISIAFFSREAILSTEIIYWTHSVYQILFFASLYLFFIILKNDDLRKNKKLSPNLLLILLFMGAWTEWMGYLSNFGLFFILWFLLCEKHSRTFAIKVALGTSLASIFTLAHYGFSIGFSNALQAFLGRFFARNTSSGNLAELIWGYGLSYGIFLVVGLIILFRAYLGKALCQRSMISSLVLASAFPLIENVIMLQHSEWAGYHSENMRLIDRLKQQVDFRCAIFASNIHVRGYANLLLGRSMYEHKSYEQAVKLNEERGGCVSVYLEDRVVFSNLQQYHQATVTWPGGRTVVLHSEANK